MMFYLGILGSFVVGFIGVTLYFLITFRFPELRPPYQVGKLYERIILQHESMDVTVIGVRSIVRSPTGYSHRIVDEVSPDADGWFVLFLTYSTRYQDCDITKSEYNSLCVKNGYLIARLNECNRLEYYSVISFTTNADNPRLRVDDEYCFDFSEADEKIISKAIVTYCSSICS